MSTKITNCNCKHKAQDELHGKGSRVFNFMKGKEGHGRCTVCGSTKFISNVTPETTTKKRK